MNKDHQDCNQVTDFLGKAFIKMPRKLLNMSIHPQKKKRRLALMYMALITLSFFRDGIVTLGKINMFAAGENMWVLIGNWPVSRLSVSVRSVIT